MSAGDRDSWREWFAELALSLDQAAAYLWTGNAEEAKDSLARARQKVDAARAQLTDAAGTIPVYQPATVPPSDIESELLPTIGPVIDALESRDDRTKRTAVDLLSRWLPRLKTEHLRHVSPYHRGILYRWLQIELAPAYPEFLALLCITLTRLQDLDALPQIRRLATSGAVTRGGKRVKAEAEACRVKLELIKAQFDSNGTLLRASVLPKDGLLRPAESPGSGEAAQLLRPSD
jgi:hypothetical protein